MYIFVGTTTSLESAIRLLNNVDESVENVEVLD